MTEEQVEYQTAPHAVDAARNGQSATQPMRLCALDRLFVATGTAEVKVANKTISLPIQAVDNELVEALVGPPPQPAVRSEMRGGTRHIIVDETNAEYLKKREEHSRRYGYVYVLCALALDIVDAADHVVWSADNTVHDFDAAKDVLKRMGLVDNQRASILTAALALTRHQEDLQVSD